MLSVKVTLQLSYVFLLNSLIVRFVYYLRRGKERGFITFKAVSYTLLLSFAIRRRFRIVDIIHCTLYKLTV